MLPPVLLNSQVMMVEMPITLSKKTKKSRGLNGTGKFAPGIRLIGRCQAPQITPMMMLEVRALLVFINRGSAYPRQPVSSAMAPPINAA